MMNKTHFAHAAISRRDAVKLATLAGLSGLFGGCVSGTPSAISRQGFLETTCFTKHDIEHLFNGALETARNEAYQNGTRSVISQLVDPLDIWGSKRTPAQIEATQLIARRIGATNVDTQGNFDPYACDVPITMNPAEWQKQSLASVGRGYIVFGQTRFHPNPLDGVQLVVCESSHPIVQQGRTVVSFPESYARLGGPFKLGSKISILGIARSGGFGLELEMQNPQGGILYAATQSASSYAVGSSGPIDARESSMAVFKRNGSVIGKIHIPVEE